MPPPAAFGFNPEKFPTWRPQQDMAVCRVIDSPKRIVAECLPTGSGKTLLGMAAGKLVRSRIVYLTRRKGLQSQIMRDFDDAFDVRGQSSYPCVYSPTVSVDLGPCHAGMYCRYKEEGCHYYDAVRVAEDPSTPIVVTNYSFWFQRAKNNKIFGNVDLLVCDEAHGVLDELSNFLTIEIARWEVERLGEKWPVGNKDDLDQWATWAGKIKISVESEIQRLKGGEPKTSPAQVREIRRLESLRDRVDSLAKAKGRWVCHLSDRQGSLIASPIWPGEYLEQYLFQNTPKVLFMSATIRPKTLELLGLKEDDFQFTEVQSTFPLQNRMVWCIDAPRMNHRMDDGDKGVWLDRIDNVLAKRLDRKTIIHVGSYARRDLLMTSSRWRNYMVGHGRDDVDEMIQRFKAARPPLIMVSQSITEGYDFPYTDCEVQIIAKIPYPDSRDPLVAARQKEDKEYGSYIAMQQVVQAAGRAVRAADDFCETIVVDGNSRWFFRQNARFAPNWFNAAVRQVEVAPNPPTNMAADRPVFNLGGH